MDADIQFGDVEEVRPEVRLRPDRNKHYAVVPFETPRDEDLPIFVDLDVMREMESHALDDTTVELGGVLLGGQYEDEDGRPFVVVTDSLRAQHYEATKGSFKFTHDTWEQISRDRDEFPEDLQMVGWYHTHPDWGVFLSGMDMFICDNFFNRLLDLALVIDPCRGDRGMFMWTGDSRQRIRRTGGFYFIASRFRQHELELYTCQLEGKLTMASDPRHIVGPVGPSAPPVVNISESRNQWQGPAIMGMLTMQFMLLCLIAWQLLGPTKAAEKTDEEKQLDRITKLEQGLETARNNQIERDAQRRVLRVIASEMGKSSAFMEDYERLTEDLKNAEIARDVRNAEREQSDRVRAELSKQVDRLTRDLENADTENESLSEKLKKESQKADDLEEAVARLEGKSGTKKTGDPAEATEENWWIYVAVTAGALVLLLVAFGAAFALRKDEEEEGEEEYKESSQDKPDGTNNDSDK